MHGSVQRSNTPLTRPALTIWLQAITRPTLRNYENLLQESNKSRKRALVWISLVWLAQFTIVLSLALSVGGLREQLYRHESSESECIEDDMMASFCPPDPFVINSLLVITGVCFSAGALPVLFVAALLVYLIFTCGIPHAIAVALGGAGTFENLVFLNSAITTAFVIYQSLLILVASFTNPAGEDDIVYMALIGTFLGVVVYIFVLRVIAIKAVHQLGWSKAIISILAWYILLIGLFAYPLFLFIS